jgi:hypothetical protein
MASGSPAWQQEAKRDGGADLGKAVYALLRVEEEGQRRGKTLTACGLAMCRVGPLASESQRIPLAPLVFSLLMIDNRQNVRGGI